jgi:hypothetical protein
VKLVVRLVLAAPFLPIAWVLSWAYNDPAEWRGLWKFVRYGR